MSEGPRNDAPPPRRSDPRSRPVVLVLGPALQAVSGVSTHVNLLLGSKLAETFDLRHFQVGSEGRNENVLGFVWRLLAGPFHLARAVRRSQASLVHVNTSLNARAFWRDCGFVVAAGLCGARVLYQIHGGALPHEFFRHSRVLTWLLQRVLRLTDAIVVLSSVELAAYRSFVPNHPSITIPNAIDEIPFRELLAARAGSPVELVYLGRLAKGKGLGILLDAVALARRRGVDIRLTVAGSGPERSRLLRACRTLGIEDIVDLVGPVGGTDKLALLQRADVFVLPSRSEGLPYALLEAMAAGAAVLTTPVGAIPDVVIDGEHGRFVPVDDVEALADGIVALVTEPEMRTRMGRAGRDRVFSSYTVERLAARFQVVYAALCTSDLGQLRSRLAQLSGQVG